MPQNTPLNVSDRKLPLTALPLKKGRVGGKKAKNSGAAALRAARSGTAHPESCHRFSSSSVVRSKRGASWPGAVSPTCYVRVLMASDIKERIAPAIQAYYKFQHKDSYHRYNCTCSYG